MFFKVRHLHDIMISSTPSGGRSIVFSEGAIEDCALPYFGVVTKFHIAAPWKPIKRSRHAQAL